MCCQIALKDLKTKHSQLKLNQMIDTKIEILFISLTTLIYKRLLKEKWEPVLEKRFYLTTPNMKI